MFDLSSSWSTVAMVNRKAHFPFTTILSMLLTCCLISATSTSFDGVQESQDIFDLISDESIANAGPSLMARSLMAQNAHLTIPSDDESTTAKRRRFPEENPHVCLAFLSCCGRTDLLNHTIAAAIRHMEEDEPDWLRYEIAWVDNGSGKENTDPIEATYQIDHALPLTQNTGLAMGMNLLIFNLCQAPYILLLEEDWLYLDEVIVNQTPARKRAITTAIALLERNLTSFDRRDVAGVFFRPETYNTFLEFPYADIWTREKVNLKSLASSAYRGYSLQESGGKSEVDVSFQIFCSDQSGRSKFLWGSYTNGAGLYRRSALEKVGRMMGEPSDVFHDRYVESNYAYRAGLNFCHAAIQLGSCQDIANRECTAAFHHIGGGRGTRPIKSKGTTCASDMWYYFGTPIGSRYKRMMERNPDFKPCSPEELMAWRSAKQRELDAHEYVVEVKEIYEKNKKEEEQEREQMRLFAKAIRDGHTDSLIAMGHTVLNGMSMEQLLAFANKMEQLANSPHPLDNYYDSHGRPLKHESKWATPPEL